MGRPIAALALLVALLGSQLAVLPAVHPVSVAAQQDDALDLPPDIAAQVEGCTTIAVSKRSVAAAGCPGGEPVTIRLPADAPDLKKVARIRPPDFFGSNRPARGNPPSAPPPADNGGGGGGGGGNGGGGDTGGGGGGGTPGQGLRIELTCRGVQEEARLFNESGGPITVQTITSLFKPRASVEPKTVNRTIGSGQFLAIMAGENAFGRRNQLGEEAAFVWAPGAVFNDDAAGEEGVEVVTDAGSFRQLCEDL